MSTPNASAYGSPLSIHLNQLGFFPKASKYFTVQSATGDHFAVINTANGTTAMTGTIDPLTFDEQAASGEHVRVGEFTLIEKPGNYLIQVGNSRSCIFRIDTDIYLELLQDALRTFFIIRSGIQIDDVLTGISHSPSHLDDAWLAEDHNLRKDVTGGWYNAADYGKWSTMAAIAVAYMLLLHEMQQKYLQKVVSSVTAAHSFDESLLEQCRWGLLWLLKMQDDDGGVRRKVDSHHNFAWGVSPDQDPNPRLVAQASTSDTAVFAAVMYAATRSFQSISPALSLRFRLAADHAWQWVCRNPSVKHHDPFYPDHEPVGERFWAMSERYATTRDPHLHYELNYDLDHQAYSAVYWGNPSSFGIYTLALMNISPAGAKARATLLRAADALIEIADKSGYGVALKTSDYTWGSVEKCLHQAALLMVAYRASGHESYRSIAIRQMDYVLGRNPLGQSYVTGFGSKPVQSPFHWTQAAFNLYMPGWASGGPNAMSEGADEPLIALQRAGTPPAKCFLDLCVSGGSWASNEGQITQNAGLLFVVGSLV